MSIKITTAKLISFLDVLSTSGLLPPQIAILAAAGIGIYRAATQGRQGALTMEQLRELLKAKGIKMEAAGNARLIELGIDPLES